MRLAHAGDRPRARGQPRNGNRIWLVTCVVTVLVVVFVAVKLTRKGCPAAPRADGPAAAAGAGGPAAPPAGAAPAGAAGASPLAARPALARSVIEGHAVFYDPGQAAGSCGLGPFPPGGWYASLPPRGYASGRACGSYLDVSRPGLARCGPRSWTCAPDCAAGTVRPEPGGLRADRQPAQGHGRGQLPGCCGPAAARAADAADHRGGAGPGTLAVQVINHGNRLSSVAASRPGGRWQQLPRAPTATGPGRCARGGPGLAPSAGGTAAALAGGGTGPAAGGRISVRVTDMAGHQVLLTGISLRSTVLHATTWMYRTRGPADGSRGLPRRGPAAANQGRPRHRPRDRQPRRTGRRAVAAAGRPDFRWRGPDRAPPARQPWSAAGRIQGS